MLNYALKKQKTKSRFKKYCKHFVIIILDCFNATLLLFNCEAGIYVLAITPSLLIIIKEQGRTGGNGKRVDNRRERGRKGK